MKIVAIEKIINGIAFLRNEKFVGSAFISFEYFRTNRFTDFLKTKERIKDSTKVPTIRIV
mgnify:FL=1